MNAQKKQDLFRTRSMHKLEKPSLLASSERRVGIPRPTAKNPLIVSASELGNFLRCRVRHHWGDQLKLVPIQYSSPRGVGTLGHQILAAFYALPYKQRSPQAMKKIAKRLCQLTKILEMPVEEKDLLIAMTTGYSEWITGDADYSDAVIGLRDTVQEQEFTLPITDDKSIWVRGKMDIVFPVHSLKKTMGFLESKFKGQIRKSEAETRIQHSVYHYALRCLFPEMKRYASYPQILRKQMPGPRVKADLFWRDMIERDIDEVEQWRIDTGRQAMDMIDGAVYPSPMESCDYACDFTIPCLLRGNAAQLKHVLKTQYKERVYEG